MDTASLHRYAAASSAPVIGGAPSSSSTSNAERPCTAALFLASNAGSSAVVSRLAMSAATCRCVTPRGSGQKSKRSGRPICDIGPKRRNSTAAQASTVSAKSFFTALAALALPSHVRDKVFRQLAARRGEPGEAGNDIGVDDARIELGERGRRRRRVPHRRRRHRGEQTERGEAPHHRPVLRHSIQRPPHNRRRSRVFCRASIDNSLPQGDGVPSTVLHKGLMGKNILDFPSRKSFRSAPKSGRIEGNAHA